MQKKRDVEKKDGFESAMAAPHRGATLSDVTIDQYELGYQLFMGLPPGVKKTKAIMAAAKLTASQVESLTTKGRPLAKPEPWPSWNDRLTGEVLLLQQNACKTAKRLSSKGVSLFEEAIRNTEEAQRMVTNILTVFGRKLKHANDHMDTDGLEKAMPGPAVRGTLAALRPYADLSYLGKAFQDIYGSPHGRKRSSGEDDVRIDLSGDYSDRGAFAFTDSHESQDGKVDVLEELMPEMAGWTVEEIDTFARTGAVPRRLMIDPASQSTSAS